LTKVKPQSLKKETWYYKGVAIWKISI